MADLKISQLPEADNLSGAVVPIVQDGTNKKAAAALFEKVTEIESISIVAGAIETPLDGNHRTLVLSEDVDSGWATPIDGDPSSQVFYSSIDIFPPLSGGPFSVSIPVEWLCMGPLDTISLGSGDDPITVTLRSWGNDNIAYVAVQGGDAVV